MPGRLPRGMRWRPFTGARGSEYRLRRWDLRPHFLRRRCRGDRLSDERRDACRVGQERFLALFPLKEVGRVELVGTVSDQALTQRKTLTWDDINMRVMRCCRSRSHARTGFLPIAFTTASRTSSGKGVLSCSEMPL